MPEETLTPVWCAACQCVVPLEKEPHHPPDRSVPHYAKDQQGPPPSEYPLRWADIHIEQQPNGYWLGRVSVKVPQLNHPHLQQNDSFHNAPEAVQWAVGIIDLLTRSV